MKSARISIPSAQAARGVSAALLGAIALACLLLAPLVLASCGPELDVVGSKAPAAFAKALAPLGFADSGGTWVLALPDGEGFTIGSGAGKGSLGLSLDAAPFLAAGLDPAKLGAGGALSFAEGRLLARGDLPGLGGGAKLASPEGAIQLIVDKERKRLGWHEALDHYGIPLAEGVMVEWARDSAANDKDFVFVLAPEPLVAAGLDPAKAAGWVYAEVESKDESGKALKAWKLLKPYSIGG